MLYEVITRGDERDLERRGRRETAGSGDGIPTRGLELQGACKARGQDYRHGGSAQGPQRSYNFV